MKIALNLIRPLLLDLLKMIGFKHAVSKDRKKEMHLVGILIERNVKIITRCKYVSNAIVDTTASHNLNYRDQGGTAISIQHDACLGNNKYWYPKDPVSFGAVAVMGDVMRGRLWRLPVRLMLPII